MSSAARRTNGAHVVHPAAGSPEIAGQPGVGVRPLGVSVTPEPDLTGLPSFYARRGKRLLDAAGAGSLLLLTVPLFATLALAIKADSPGPVLYRSRRCGRDGAEFDMFKLRKMLNGAGGSPLTVAGDDRFTRLGSWLARTKLDELPQLWNVIRGDMSLVGPRPEDPAFAALLPDSFAAVQRARPGITGPAQLLFSDESSMLDPDRREADYLERILPVKLALDARYARCPRLGLDLRVLGWTVLTRLLPVEVVVDERSLRPRHRTRGGVVRRPSPVRR